jgi:acyl-CoA synthetase (AMP-forming)/AMP-acid ligase II
VTKMANEALLPSKATLFLNKFSLNVRDTPNKVAATFLGPASSSSSSDSSAAAGKVEQSYTYKQLDVLSSALAMDILSPSPKQKHQTTPVKRGDRVVLVYPPSLDFLIAFLACMKAGIIAVPVFPPNPLRPSSVRMFAVVVANCQAAAAFTNTSYQHAKKMSSISSTFRKLVLPTSGSTGTDTKSVAWPEHLTWIDTASLLSKTTSSNNESVPSTVFADPDPDSICFLQYTSGSTSDPKGVMITHANLAHNLTIITQELAAENDTVVVSWLPQYHDMGLIGSLLGTLFCGGAFVGMYYNGFSCSSRPFHSLAHSPLSFSIHLCRHVPAIISSNTDPMDLCHVEVPRYPLSSSELRV